MSESPERGPESPERGPESPERAPESPSSNPFENAQPGDKFYAVSDLEGGYEGLTVWVEHDPHEEVSIAKDDLGGKRGVVTFERSEVGLVWTTEELEVKQGDTLEILEAAREPGGFKIRYTPKSTGGPRIVLLPTQTIANCRVEWAKDRRGPVSPKIVISQARSKQLLEVPHSARSTDTVDDGIWLGALAQWVRSRILERGGDW